MKTYLIYKTILSFSIIILTQNVFAEASSGAAAGTGTAASAEGFNTTVSNTVTAINNGSAIIQPTQTNTALQNLKKSSDAYAQAAKACDEQVKTAAELCDEKLNPKAADIGTKMAKGAEIIGQLISLSDTCSKMADLSKNQEAATKAVGDTCASNMTSCTSLCTKAGTALKDTQQKITALVTAIKADAAKSIQQELSSGSYAHAAGYELEAKAQSLSAPASAQQGAAVSPALTSCSARSVDVAKFAAQGLSLAKAFMGGSDCEKKVSADGSDAGSGADNALEDMSGAGGSDSGQNASVELTQECKTDSKSTACEQSKIASVRLDPTGKGSQLAGPGSAFKQTVGSGAGGISALNDGTGTGLNSKITSDGTGFSAAAGGTSPGSGTGVVATKTAADKNSDDLNKGKSGQGFFGSLGGSIGGMFGGSKKSASEKFTNEEKVAKAKRQMASEELQKEISPASGKSNWEKVYDRYSANANSLLGN